MNLFGLIKVCLKETYGEIRIGKHLFDIFSYREWSKTRRCFIATAFQPCFRVWHSEGPGRPGGSDFSGAASAGGLC
jgi:hypothetical protein